MSGKHLAKLMEFGGLAFLGGTAFYLAKRNEHLENIVKGLRKDFLRQSDKVELLRNTLKVTHEKYMNLRDNLREHVEAMIDITDKKNEGWIEDVDILSKNFPEKDMQFLAPDILIAKLSGLIDAFILNKWSILPSEYKKIKKSMLSNGERLDIYNKNDIELVLEKLTNAAYIDLTEREFIASFYSFYKEKIIINGDLPENYNSEDIEYYFDFTVNMILKKS